MLSFSIVILSYFCLAQGQTADSIIRQNRPLSSATFDEITINGAFDVSLTQLKKGIETPSVEIEATAEAQKKIIVEIIDNHILSIYVRDSILVSKVINVFIRFNSPLRRYTASGTGNTMTDDKGISNEQDDTFVLVNRGAVNFALSLNVHNFEGTFSGTTNSRFWGKVRQQATFDADGVGNIDALGLEAKFVNVEAKGVSNIRVTATDDMNIDAKGVAKVYYRLPGRKTPSKTSTSGLGTILPVT